MKWFKKSKSVVVSIIVVITLAILLLATYASSSVGSLANGLSWIDRVVALPFQWIKETKDNFSDLLKTFEENRIIKEKLYESMGQESELASIKKENEQLKGLLNLQSLYEGRFQQTAKVINRVPVSWDNELIIDKGSDAQLTTPMLVLAAGGLVGTVERVNAQSSRVRLLSSSDEASGVAVKILSGDHFVYGILTGYNQEKGTFIISQLNSSDSLESGAQVTTSGLGTYTIADIPVGTIQEVIESGDQLSRQVLVKPTADLSDIRVVTVVGNQT